VRKCQNMANFNTKLWYQKSNDVSIFSENLNFDNMRRDMLTAKDAHEWESLTRFSTSGFFVKQYPWVP
jgi:hypothetical protein